MTLPRRLHLELTNRCNSKCRTCVRTMAPEPDADLPLEQALRITEALPELESVALQVNGEPLLYPHLPELVRALSRRGIHVELNTNGIALSHRRAAALIDSGLERLNVSVDGVRPETYALLRGVPALGKVIAGLRAFRKARGPAPAKPELALWMTMTQYNYEELPGLVELAADVGAEIVFLQRLVHFGFGAATFSASLHGRRNGFDVQLARAMDLAGERGIELRTCGRQRPDQMLCGSKDAEPWRNCRRMWESAVVMANGDVVPCCISTFVASREQIRCGNLFESDWETIWEGPEYRRHRQQLSDGGGPSFCWQCGVDWSL